MAPKTYSMFAKVYGKRTVVIVVLAHVRSLQQDSGGEWTLENGAAFPIYGFSDADATNLAILLAGNEFFVLVDV